jgi:hypothetical protein
MKEKSKKSSSLLIDDKRDIPADKTVRTLEEGLNALQENKWDFLFLDDHLSEDKDANEGEKVLQWLEKNPEHLPRHIILVTDDLPAHAKMQKREECR